MTIVPFDLIYEELLRADEESLAFALLETVAVVISTLVFAPSGLMCEAFLTFLDAVISTLVSANKNVQRAHTDATTIRNSIGFCAGLFCVVAVK